MATLNRYCTRCNKTTKFQVDGGVYTCAGCGVRVVPQRAKDERILWGDPFRFRIRFV